MFILFLLFPLPFLVMLLIGVSVIFTIFVHLLPFILLGLAIWGVWRFVFKKRRV